MKEELCAICKNKESICKGLIVRTHTFKQEKGWEWEKEFRGYFDKTLKPKKPTIKNLDRELIVDFISKVEKRAILGAYTRGLKKGMEKGENIYRSSLLKLVDNNSHKNTKGEDILYSAQIIRLIGEIS